MDIKVIFLIGAVFLIWPTECFPFESLKLEPLMMVAPLSQIRWNSRGDWQKSFEKFDMEPKSYHMQHSTFNDVLKTHDSEPSESRISEQSTDSQYFNLDDQPMVPNRVEYMVKHPAHYKRNRMSQRSSKTLQISYEPSFGSSISKLKISDTLLDSLDKFTTEVSKRAATARTTKKPTVPNKLIPKPIPKPSHKVKHSSSRGPVDEVEEEVTVSEQPSSSAAPVPVRPQNNHLAGQSQIGNRESQMVIKPTVIVNIRGTVSNTDSDIKVESRANEDETNSTNPAAQNVFNINQEVNIERTYSLFDEYADFESTKRHKKPKANYLELRPSEKIEIFINDNQADQEKSTLPIEFTESTYPEIFLIEETTEKFAEIMKAPAREGKSVKKNMKEPSVFSPGPLGGFLKT